MALSLSKDVFSFPKLKIDDVISGSSKKINHKIDNISGNI